MVQEKGENLINAMRRKKNPSKEIFDQIYNVYKNVKPKCKELKKPVIRKFRTSENKKIKDLAWKWFSKYIRLRDCLKTTGTKEYGKCYTCDRIKPFKELQAGHLVSSRCNSILLDEEIVHAQCKRCNIELGGNYTEYTIRMTREKGIDWVEAKQNLKHITMDRDWKAEKENWKEKYNLLMFGKPKKLPWEKKSSALKLIKTEESL